MTMTFGHKTTTKPVTTEFTVNSINDALDLVGVLAKASYKVWMAEQCDIEDYYTVCVEGDKTETTYDPDWQARQAKAVDNIYKGPLATEGVVEEGIENDEPSVFHYVISEGQLADVDDMLCRLKENPYDQKMWSRDRVVRIAIEKGLEYMGNACDEGDEDGTE